MSGAEAKAEQAHEHEHEHEHAHAHENEHEHAPVFETTATATTTATAHASSSDLLRRRSLNGPTGDAHELQHPHELQHAYDRPDSAQWAAIVNIHKELRHSMSSNSTDRSSTGNGKGKGNGSSAVAGSASGGSAAAAVPSKKSTSTTETKKKKKRKSRKETKDAVAVPTVTVTGDSDAAAAAAAAADLIALASGATVAVVATPNLTTTTTKGKKTKKEKKKKDPNQPKRPPSAFFLFIKAESESLKASYPNLAQPEIVSVMGEAWRTASDEDKRPYLEQNRAAQILYREECKAAAVLANMDLSLSIPASAAAPEVDVAPTAASAPQQPKSKQATTAATTNAAAATTNVVSLAGRKRRVNDDGCLEPKAKPLQKEDGSFYRPRGAAPAGFSWGVVDGVWIPAVVEVSNPRTETTEPPVSNKQTNQLTEKQKATANANARTKTKTQRLMNDGCMEPKSEPQKKPDGTFARPRGMPPAGYTWNETSGRWVPVPQAHPQPQPQTLGDAVSTASTRPISNKQSVVHTHTASVLERGGSDTDTVFSDDASSSSLPLLARKQTLTDDAKLPAQTAIKPVGRYKRPKTELTKNKDGSYRRPRGGAPAGHDWDSALGVWVAHQGSNLNSDAPKRVPNHGSWQKTGGTSRPSIQNGGLGSLDDMLLSDLARVANTAVPQSHRAPGMPQPRELAPHSPTKEKRLDLNRRLNPKATLQKKGDGTYLRPRGRPPAGCLWESKTGTWVPTNAKSVPIEGLAGTCNVEASEMDPTDAMGALSSTTRSFLATLGITTKEQFLSKGAGETAEVYTQWRAERNMLPMAATVASAAVGKWKDSVRKRSTALSGNTRSLSTKERISNKPKTAPNRPARTSPASPNGGVLASAANDSNATFGSMSRDGLNDPLHALAPEVRLLLARQGITTPEQLLSRGTGEIAEAYTKWRAEANMPRLKVKNSASSYVSTWKSVVRKAASVELGINTSHPPKRRGRPKGPKRMRADSLDDPTTKRRPLQESQSREKRRRVEKTTSTSKPTYVACGACQGCRTTESCGTCLPCRRRIDTLAGCYEPDCAHRICIAPVLRSSTSNKAENAPFSMAGTNGSRSGHTSSRRTAVRPAESVVESLSDHDPLVMDDMSDLESPAGPSRERKGNLFAASRASSEKRSHSKALSGADLARQLQHADRFRIHFDDSDEDEEV
jgi:hypothetical protein